LSLIATQELIRTNIQMSFFFNLFTILSTTENVGRPWTCHSTCRSCPQSTLASSRP